MGGRDRDDAGPVLPPLSAERARVVTAGLREALEDVRRAVGVLAARVLAAHAARVWAPLGYPSWAAYCAAEFGISRAQAYRLLDVAHALGTIQAAVTAGTPVPRMRDTTPPPAAVLDYGLSQRALIAASARSCDVADLITAASPRSPTAASRPSTSPPCAPWSARPSATSGLDLARVALRTAIEAARANGGGRKVKAKPRSEPLDRDDELIRKVRFHARGQAADPDS
ncbi:hypothetical protein, partial [Streptomyces sp. NPDC057545]|uniref:hypothetical protein n=1 Tax=Streptomyces sp. NPDC057545 TaxID=3346164 RepID=UPI003679985E